MLQMTGCHVLDDDYDVKTNLLLAAHTAHWPMVLYLAARCLTLHHRVALSALLLPNLRRLAALSLTTECQGHSRKWQLKELLADSCTVLPDGALLQECMLSGPNILAHGPLITYEQDVNCKSAL